MNPAKKESPRRLSAQVSAAEFGRRVGTPTDRRLEGRAAFITAYARAWYSRNGRPWTHVREVGISRVNGNVVHLETGDENDQSQKELHCDDHSAMPSGAGEGCFLVCQSWPAVIMQDMPCGVVTMMVQVLPSSVASTSIRPPLLVMPTATGDSPYLLAR